MVCIVGGAIGGMILVGINAKFPVLQEAPALLLRISLLTNGVENPTVGPCIDMCLDRQINRFLQNF